MFGLADFWRFLWSLLLIYPLVIFIHELGHAFFVKLLGGNFRLMIGRGRQLFKKGPFSLHVMYFLDSYCEYAKLKWNNRLTHFLVHAGGILFNLASVLILNLLISNGYLEERKVFEQFSYFSVWLSVFSLVPVDYGDENYSDGLAIYFVLRYRKWPKLTG
ncbi:site-2 protease family protein [Mesobacillus foraminis]|uniref:site-2 protease family protein n=1 Tax=Mesobacillus foraminis TaxID=279826 RepID=UPI000EF4BAB1|nr:site-2 protease family protein [Mesobacillus foraminis]